MTLDWSTLAFQTVNVAVLLWLLSRVFWKPIAKMIADRRAEAAGILSDAAARRDEAEKLRNALMEDRKQIAADRQAMVSEATAAGEAERSRILAEAQAEAARIEAAAKARIETARSETEAQFAARAQDLAAEMSSRLGQALDGPAYRAANLAAIAGRVSALPGEERAALGADPLTVTSAMPLDTDERTQIAAALTAATGGAPSLDFQVDPALIAGIELTGPHLTIAGSWREGMARMRKEIARDG